MSKHDFESAKAMLDSLKKSFDLNSFEKIGTETEFGKEVALILSQYTNNPNAKNLDFQYKKLIQIANDIQHLKLANDATLPDWLEEELEAVFRKIKDTLVILENDL
ncbi:MAG: hypothetical protein EOO44_12765 [Flavobacterium sp.]|nr:MAG: hypothetical protein EOO44_12765 [Flavobacterium sp.]